MSVIKTLFLGAIVAIFLVAIVAILVMLFIIGLNIVIIITTASIICAEIVKCDFWNCQFTKIVKEHECYQNGEPVNCSTIDSIQIG
jgi:hypothetical protein